MTHTPTVIFSMLPKELSTDLTSLNEDQDRLAVVSDMVSGRMGEQFDAIVTGAGPKGTWVRTFRPPVEGRLERGFAGLDVGDHIRVRLIHTDVERGFIDFGRD